MGWLDDYITGEFLDGFNKIQKKAVAGHLERFQCKDLTPRQIEEALWERLAIYLGKSTSQEVPYMDYGKAALTPEDRIMKDPNAGIECDPQ